MRFHYHDVRDMPMAILLACDIRRVVNASLGVAWTLAIAGGLILLIGWRATDEVGLNAAGIEIALETLGQPPTTIATVSFWVCVLTGWWLGFGYITAPNLRSAALEIARDERGKLPPEPVLYRMAAGAPPLAMLIPACFALVCLVLAPLAHIGGVAGGIALAVSLPVSLIFALLAAAGFLLVAVSAPMMPPTAVVEGRDYLEAISRPAGFVLQKPFRYAGYWLAKLGVVVFAAVVGCAIFALAWAIIAGCIALFGAGEVVQKAWELATLAPPALGPNGVAPTGPEMPELAMASVGWASAAVLFAWMCVVSQSADLIIYLLMRYRIEGATFDQVLVAEERLQLLPNAVQTAEQAEEARKRFDEEQAKEPVQAAPK